MDKIYMLETTPIFTKHSEEKTESNDQMRIDSAQISDSRDGTIIFLHECHVGKEKIEAFAASYSAFRKAQSDINFWCQNDAELPAMAPVFEAPENPEFIFRMESEDNLIPLRVFFTVHHGIGGWSISGISKTNFVLGEMHPKFQQYRFKDFSLKTKVENKNLVEICQDTFSYFTDTTPDPRLAV